MVLVVRHERIDAREYILSINLVQFRTAVVLLCRAL